MTTTMHLVVGVVIAALSGVTAIVHTTHNATIQGEDVCESEYLEANCGAGEVIVMTVAKYGRMKINKCVREDFGYVGCSTDVLTAVDRLCSGRRSCRFRVLDETLDGAHPCHDDLKSYLRVIYTCVKVSSPPEGVTCRDIAPPVLTSSSGYIASIVSDHTGCGLADSPWIIEVQPGQRINITLLDFSQRPPTASNANTMPSLPGGSHADEVCRVYFTLREVAHSRSNTVCANHARVRNVYISNTNRVEVRILNSQTPTTPNYFLLKYEAFGCPILDPPTNGWIQQDGELALFGCDNDNGLEWRLVCVKSQWKGENHTCMPDTTQSPLHGGSEGFLSLSLEMCIVLILILAGSVGLFILILGLLCIKWKHLPACCRCSRRKSTAMSAMDHGRDDYSLKPGVLAVDPMCAATTYTYTTKLANNDLVYHPEHDFACSRLLGNAMPDIMHGNTDHQAGDQGVHHASYDSPHHITACQQQQQQQQQQRSCENVGAAAAAGEEETCNAVVCGSAASNSTENPYGQCVQHYFDVVGATNCVSLVPCAAASYVAPVTVATENTPKVTATSTTGGATSTFGKPLAQEATYAAPPARNQSCVTAVNDGTCRVSVCEDGTRYEAGTYGTAKNKL